MANYEFFYEGTPSTLDPAYGEIFTGYRVPAAHIGATTSIQTANQLREVTNLLNQGIKNVEISAINPEVFEMIPKQHLKEINRLNKLTGAEASLHAPLIDPSGFTQQGWNEINRVGAEKQIIEIIKRSQELSPDGNMPVTIHASAVPGTEWIPSPEKPGEEIKEKMIAVNQETGEMTGMIREKRFYPGRALPEGKMYTPEEELEIANISYWDNQLSNLIFYKERADELLTKYYPQYTGEKEELLTDEQKKARAYAQHNAMVYLDNTYQVLNGLFNRAYKFSDEEGKKVLNNSAEDFKKQFEKARAGGGVNPSYFSGAMQGLINSMQQITSPTAEKEKSHIPQVYKQIEEFTQDKASQTLGNVAFNAYKEFGDKAPIISIENPPYGSAIARAEDLKKLIEMTREKFIKKAEAEGMSASKAKDAADKLIGATWDTSHISMMRKQGFKPEKLVEEAKLIAPFVKHVHLNDNFGSTHTDLPPGMGSAPMKEVLQEFEKAGVKGKKVFEGGAFFQHFQVSPHPYILEALGSPLYSMQMAPYWNQIMALYGNYFSGYGPILPQQHFSTYGLGFTSLPMELGGQVTGGQSKFAGTPNQ